MMVNEMLQLQMSGSEVLIQEEIWKDIVGYEGYYQISNCGRVKSLSRLNASGHQLKEKILKPGKDGNGYLYVILYKNKKMKNYHIHSLVADSFIGTRPDGYEICHYDGNKLNNNPENLRYDTRSANQLDRNRHGTSNKGKNHGLIAENNSYAKLTNDIVLNDIIPSLKAGETQRSIAKRLRVNYMTIHYISIGKYWSSITGIEYYPKMKGLNL